MIYLIGSLRNPEVPVIAGKLRAEGFEVFDDWFAAGPAADDCWRDYEKGRGHSYSEALSGHAARNVFAFDRKHLDRSEAVILVLPAGKSGHLELGYALGSGKRGYILLDSPDRWDVMYQFATLVTQDLQEIIDHELPFTRPADEESGDAVDWSGAPTTVDPFPGTFAPYLGPTKWYDHNQLGLEISKPSVPSSELVKGPLDSDWGCYCGVGPLGCICGFQWFSPRDVGR